MALFGVVVGSTGGVCRSWLLDRRVNGRSGEVTLFGGIGISANEVKIRGRFSRGTGRLDAGKGLHAPRASLSTSLIQPPIRSCTHYPAKRA